MKTPWFALLLLAATSLHADAARDIGRFVEQTLRAIPDVPSLGMAVVRDGRVVYLRSPQTGYYIASTTKAYTGLACALLANQGLIDLDAPISSVLPEVRLATTLRSFLTHTSGLENDPIAFRAAFSGEHDPAQLTMMLNSSKPGKPGFHYDNLGYIVASLVIERVTGKPWQTALDELIFAPLHMTHTTAYMSKAQRWPLATPYTTNASGELVVLQFRKSDQTMHAAGGIVTTPADLALWLNANVHQGRVERKQVIPAKAFQEAQRLQVPVTQDVVFPTRGYGFGWYQADHDGMSVLIHQGGYEGWQSVFSFAPEKKIGVGIMMNANGPALLALQLITAYTYDRLSGRSDVESLYTQRLQETQQKIQQQKAAMLADVAKRSQRPWMLSHAHAAYQGRYANPLYGTLVIEERDGRLVASIGALQSALQAFTEPESARVELPPGSGSVLRFTFGTAVDADSIRWQGEEFPRVK